MALYRIIHDRRWETPKQCGSATFVRSLPWTKPLVPEIGFRFSLLEKPKAEPPAIRLAARFFSGIPDGGLDLDIRAVEVRAAAPGPAIAPEPHTAAAVPGPGH